MTRKRPHLLTPAIGVVLAVAALAVGATFGPSLNHAYRQVTAQPTATPPTPERTYTVAGTLRLTAGKYTRDGAGCRGTTIGDEPQVVVTDGNGRALTYAPLGAGRLAGGACELPFTTQVPAGKGSYGIDVPWWGTATYTEQELADPDILTRTFG